MAGVTCEKRRIGDEFYCARCRTRWGTSDPEPPACDAEQQQPITLTERLRALSTRMRAATILPSLVDDLDDMIEEVKLLDDARRQAKANVIGGAGPNVTPIRPRGA